MTTKTVQVVPGDGLQIPITEVEQHLGCDHGEDKTWTPLTYLPLGEVFMCACGALIDSMYSENFEPGIWHTMTPSGLEKQIAEIIQDERQRIVKAITDIVKTKGGQMNFRTAYILVTTLVNWFFFAVWSRRSWSNALLKLLFLVLALVGSVLFLMDVGLVLAL